MIQGAGAVNKGFDDLRNAKTFFLCVKFIRVKTPHFFNDCFICLNFPPFSF